MDREHKRYNLNFCLPCKGWFCSLPCSLSWVISMCWRKVCALCGWCMNFFSTTSIMSADLSSTRPAINACCLLPAWMEISFELYLVLQLFVELPSPTPTHYSICFDSLLFVMHLRKDPFSPNLLEFPWAFSQDLESYQQLFPWNLPFAPSLLPYGEDVCSLMVTQRPSSFLSLLHCIMLVSVGYQKTLILEHGQSHCVAYSSLEAHHWIFLFCLLSSPSLSFLVYFWLIISIAF